ncbi:putative Choline Transporter-like (CTL) Family Protein [Monocercomonoides exilis]|uniref:putative Choline Transporter-like (CTL) Family Protein n=1 Tax=Monocercomonoides exilis TaxID=2049356 RepID=UPI00355A0584|nr:putative Choline Transporter-like (CTL) Family Protein [Monocercomonoides exilis]|eukprot:MONOS_2602.1-p1 / transcript=MONOS_2602.1 / gene=MONOS_2602 / organism=Monocercomonoides_exilis_PA203 / gene_product=Choline Transporter-like (CTL) Family Protein / transcript_product=Choline Transporter-like (CTL) Family Protein / location=Mono_scaffold00054:147330-149781(-) / protein_length=766 / sequence_SO=supercontig / SO=protein_coding / is_pseudo=false
MFFLVAAFPDFGDKENNIQIKNGRLNFSATRNKCNDFKCLIAFLIVVAVFAVFFIYSAAVSNLQQFSMPYDYRGDICGAKGDVDLTKKPTLFSPHGNDLGNGWCVKSCPTKTLTCMCVDEEPIEAENESDCEFHGDQCYFMNNTMFHENHHYCIPESPQSREYENAAHSVLVDFVSSFWTIIVAAIIAVVLCFAYMGCMSCCARTCVWACIFMGLGCFFLAGFIMIVLGIAFIGKASEDDKGAFTALILFGLVILAFGLVASCCLYCCKERITLVSYLIEAASKAITSMPCLPLFSALFSVVSCIVSVLCFFSILFYVSSRDLEKVDGSWTVVLPGYAWIFILFVFVAYVWMVMFVFGMNQMTIGGSITSWYFTRNRSGENSTRESWPILSSFKRALRYHSGSVAFGSGLITACTVMQVLAQLAADSAKESGNDILQCLCALIACIVEKIEHYLEFITSRVYVLISIKGEPFWPSAKQTMFLLLRNLITNVVLEDLLPYIFGIIEFLIDVVSMFFLLLMTRPDFFAGGSDADSYWPNSAWWLTLLLGFFLIVFVVDTIFDTYVFGVTSVFISFLLDDEMCQTNENWQPFGTSDLRERMYGMKVKGYTMAQKYKEKHENFNLAYYAEPPPTYVDPYAHRHDETQMYVQPQPMVQQQYTYPAPPQQQPQQQQMQATPYVDPTTMYSSPPAAYPQQPYAQPPYAQPPYAQPPYAQPGVAPAGAPQYPSPPVNYPTEPTVYPSPSGDPVYPSAPMGTMNNPGRDDLGKE